MHNVYVPPQVVMGDITERMNCCLLFLMHGWNTTKYKCFSRCWFYFSRFWNNFSIRNIRHRRKTQCKEQPTANGKIMFDMHVAPFTFHHHHHPSKCVFRRFSSVNMTKPIYTKCKANRHCENCFFSRLPKMHFRCLVCFCVLPNKVKKPVKNK